MNNTHDIDCHVLTLPRFKPEWLEQMRQDLGAEPVNQHWMEGIDGDLGAARATGFSAGSAPFVSSQDPDDRLLPGTYAALHQALLDNPSAPFAWAGEHATDDELNLLPIRPNVHSGGYSPVTHASKGHHVHGVKLYRRELVMPLLNGMREVGLCCEFFLDFALAKPYTHPPRSAWPVHVPIVGRLWRQHFSNGSRQFQPDNFDKMAEVLGLSSMDELRALAFAKGPK